MGSRRPAPLATSARIWKLAGSAAPSWRRYRVLLPDACTTARTFFNAIFRPEDGTAWQARHGLDASRYQQEFDKWTKAGYRLLHVETYLHGSAVLFAGIWVKAAGPAWVAYHGRPAGDHQN